MKADAVSVVEAGYAVDLPEAEWVKRICRAAWTAFGMGLGCAAYVFDFSGEAPEVRGFHSIGTAASLQPDVVYTTMHRLPLDLIRKLHAPSPPTVLLNQVLRVPLVEHPLAQRRVLDEDRIVDYVGVRASGGEHRGLLFTFPLTGRFKGLSPRTRQTLDRVAAHLTAAYRLRSQPDAHFCPETASAVLTPDARVEHVGSDEEARHSTGALVDAVRRMEHARVQLRLKDPAESLAEWRALVRGRWSVLDFVDRDGKRFILARRNEPRGRDLMAITDPERQVLELASLGRTNKQIAYELGLAPSTITVHLKRGLRRLGLMSRAELDGLSAQQQRTRDAS